ncbi:MAG TPA: RDD family protein [Streptosporangiaceae bacterium]|jgi:uncharacterized RDD family membrane protein YckC
MSGPDGHADSLGLQGHRAGLVSRSLAAGIDVAVVAVLYLLVQVATGVARYLFLGPPFALPDLPQFFGLIEFAVIAFGYLVWGWTTSGRTPGDQVMGLRVVSRSGRGLDPTRAALRAVLCLVFPAGLLWVAVSRRNSAVHDLIVYSAVIYDWSYRPAPGEEAVSGAEFTAVPRRGYRRPVRPKCAPSSTA